MQRKNMYEVNQAINSIDPAKTIDGKICKGKEAFKNHNTTSSTGPWKEQPGGCGGTTNTSTTASNAVGEGLSRLWDPVANTANGGGGYDKASTENMGGHTSEKISRDIRDLTREQHGVVSSAFAKAHEGAEIVIAVDIHH